MKFMHFMNDRKKQTRLNKTTAPIRDNIYGLYMFGYAPYNQTVCINTVVNARHDKIIKTIDIMQSKESC